MTNLSSAIAQNLYSAASTRELDRLLAEAAGVPAFELMQQAGAAAFAIMRREWPQAKAIVVLCGRGNNGGDGYVLARLAAESGLDVKVIRAGDTLPPAGSAAGQALAACEAVDLQAQNFQPDCLAGAEVIVDALFGTGLDRDLQPEYQTLIEEVNRQAVPVFSLDLPSGLHADTGRPLPVAVQADATVTFIAMKAGLFTAAGPALRGELFFADLNVPANMYSAVEATAQRIHYAGLTDFLPPRPRDLHKGQCGQVLVIGGDYGYAGAVLMAAEAAMRVGAGRVRIATRPEHAQSLALARAELMTAAIRDAQDLLPLLNQASVIVIGPGLGQGVWGLSLLAAVLQSQLPVVVDADALNLLAADAVHKDQWILTPHPGEAARLLGCSNEDIQADRFAAARNIQQKYGGICVLKGSGSLVVDQHLRIAICDAGNPGMASAGMGDVLSGVLGGLLAQGLKLADAAQLGVCMHSTAADRAARAGERGLLAGDLMPELRSLANPGAL